MKKIFEKIHMPMNNFKIANKMMFIYVIGGFIPLLLLSFYLIGYTRSLLIDQATQEALNNASRIEERMQDIFRISIDVSDGIYLDDQIRKLIKTDYKDPVEVINDQNQYTKMDDYLRLYPELDSIRFYVKNDSLFNDSQIIPINKYHEATDWYQVAIENNGKIDYKYHYDDITREYHLSLIRLVKDEHGKELGVLVINIDDRTLRKLMGSEPYEVIGVLDNTQIFLSTKPDFEGLYLDENWNIQGVEKQSDTILDYTDNNRKYKVITDDFITHNSNNHIRLLTIIPVENFVGFANESIKNSMALISVSVVIALVMVYFLTRILSDRIEEFRKNLHKVATGDFEVDYKIQGTDEIGSLFVDLEVMTTSIKNLINEIYEAGVQKEKLTLRQREVEFKMLASQVDPHFLYNTLETIRMEAVINDQLEIAQIVKKLASLMRRKLSISNDEVSLDAELELLSDYLEIQKFRFRERVSFSITRSCDTEHFKILPLLLQPVVENAFIHGLEKKIGPGNIHIIISESEKFLEILIEDDGIGIEENMLKVLKSKMEQDMLTTGESVGLSNVYQRTRLYYKPPYHIEIESEENIGTSVKFFLPKRNKTIGED